MSKKQVYIFETPLYKGTCKNLWFKWSNFNFFRLQNMVNMGDLFHKILFTSCKTLFCCNVAKFCHKENFSLEKTNIIICIFFDNYITFLMILSTIKKLGRDFFFGKEKNVCLPLIMSYTIIPWCCMCTLKSLGYVLR